MKLTEKKIRTKVAYKGFFLQVQKDEVSLPNGRKTFREYIKHPGASMIIPILPNGNLVMIQQFRYPLKKVFLEFPAGKIDKGETALATAKRELKEETGYIAKNWRHLTTIHPVIGYANEKIEIFLAQNLLQKEIQLDKDELLENVVVAPEELMDLVKKSKITDVKTQVGVFWLEKVIKDKW